MELTTFCIGINMTDKLRVMGASDPVLKIIAKSIRAGWGVIQEEGVFRRGTYEFKFKGNPWRATGMETTQVRRFMCEMFKSLLLNGWEFVDSAQISKKDSEKETLFFRLMKTKLINVDYVSAFSVTFILKDRVRIVDPPPGIVKMVQDSAERQWKVGLQETREFEGGSEIQFRGNPWKTYDGAEMVMIRMFLNDMVTSFEKDGFMLTASVDLFTGGAEDSKELDTWFFMKVQHVQKFPEICNEAS